jgi:hypothetical protein
MLKPTVLSRRIVLLPLLVLAAAGKAPVSNWESVQMLAPGTEVRFAAGTAKVVDGTLVSVTDTTLLILSVGAGQQPIEKTRIASISVKKQGHRLRNTVIGLGVGLAVGAVEGVAIGSCKTCKLDQSTLGYAMGGGAFWGAAVGAGWRTGGWRHVYER